MFENPPQSAMPIDLASLVQVVRLSREEPSAQDRGKRSRSEEDDEEIDIVELEEHQLRHAMRQSLVDFHYTGASSRVDPPIEQTVPIIEVPEEVGTSVPPMDPLSQTQTEPSSSIVDPAPTETGAVEAP